VEGGILASPRIGNGVNYRMLKYITILIKRSYAYSAIGVAVLAMFSLPHASFITEGFGKLAPISQVTSDGELSVALFPFRRVSVTGGSGAIGSQLHRTLERVPHVKSISVLSRPSGKNTRISGSEKVEVVQGDLLDIEALKKLVESGEVIFHLGGWSNIGPKPKIEEIFATNVLSTAVLSQLAQSHQRKFIFASTTFVYNLGTQRPDTTISEDSFHLRPELEPWVRTSQDEFSRLANQIAMGSLTFADSLPMISEFLEKTPIPLPTDANLYALSKLIAERLVVQTQGMVFRFSNVYGPGDDSDRAVPKFFKQMTEAKEPKEFKFVPGRENAYIFVGDVVDALIRGARLIGDLPEGISPIFTISYPVNISQGDLFKRLNELTGGKHRIIPLSQEEMAELSLSVPPPIVFDTSKMTELLGLSVETLTDIRTGLDFTQRWLFEPEKTKWTSFTRWISQSPETSL